jgi:hypothetical protein
MEWTEADFAAAEKQGKLEFNPNGSITPRRSSAKFRKHGLEANG